MSSSYHGLYCHIIMSCHVLSCHHTTSCSVMSSYHVMYCYAIIPCHLVSCHHTMSCIVMPSCNVMYCHVITPCHVAGSTRGWGTTTPGARAPRCTMMCRCSSAKCSPPQLPVGRLDPSHHNCSHALDLKYTFTCLSTAWPKVQNRG